jgi:hypothetical protein
MRTDLNESAGAFRFDLLEVRLTGLWEFRQQGNFKAIAHLDVTSGAAAIAARISRSSFL